MAVKEPERIWWKPLGKDERIWIILALIWMLASFFFMPVYHVIGSQNPPAETYRVTAEQFEGLVGGMVDKYKVGEEDGVPIVHPEPGSDVYLKAGGWAWYPILELEKDKTYRVHLSSTDLQHGFSVQPINLNMMVLPGYDYVMTLKPTTAGEFGVVCNEYCGPGHHQMAGKIYVR